MPSSATCCTGAANRRTRSNNGCRLASAPASARAVLTVRATSLRVARPVPTALPPADTHPQTPRKVGVDRNPALLDRRLESSLAEGQHTAATQRTQHHRADDAMVTLGHRVHIEQHDALRLTATSSMSCLSFAVPSPIALFSLIAYERCEDAINVVLSRVTNPRCIARPPRQAPMQHAVHVPDAGMSAMIGSRPAAGGGCLRKKLEVVDGRARALRHTRHRRRLGEIALGLGDANQPVRRVRRRPVHPGPRWSA